MFTARYELNILIRRVCKLSKSEYWFRHVCPSAWNNSATTGEILIIFKIAGCFEYLSRKFKLPYNLTRITGTLHAALYTFITTSRRILLRMRSASDKRCRKNQNTVFHENCVVYENVRKYGRARETTDNTMWRMRLSCWITKAAHTDSEYVKFSAFPLQQ